MNKRQKLVKKRKAQAEFVEFLNAPVGALEVFVAFAVAGVIVMLISVLAAAAAGGR